MSDERKILRAFNERKAASEMSDEQIAAAEIAAAKAAAKEEAAEKLALRLAHSQGKISAAQYCRYQKWLEVLANI
jgi:hypothetical protein